MEQKVNECQEINIDISRCIRMLMKRWKIFLAVFLLITCGSIAHILIAPKIYEISMMLKPPVDGDSSSGARSLETAGNLKGLIENDAFNGGLIKRLNFDPKENGVDFRVRIPVGTDILLVSVNLEDKRKELGVTILRALSEVIMETYAEQIGFRNTYIESQIRENERTISIAQEATKNIDMQIKEITAREDALREDLKNINLSTEKIIGKLKDILTKDDAGETTSTLLLTTFTQNNLSYVTLLNNQFSDLSIRKAALNLEQKNVNSQIRDAHDAIEKFNADKVFVANLRVLSEPKISPVPVSPNKKSILILALILGVSLGLLAAFLQEIWVTNIKKI